MGQVKSVLIVGGSGFVGTHLALRLREEYKVYATYHHHPINIRGVTCLPLNVNLVEKNKRVVHVAGPDVVIYAAGNNNTEWAANNAQDAERVHVQDAISVLKVATTYQPKFIYLSSCYAFEGLKGNYHEDDHLSATTTLGKLKGTAEGLVKTRSMNYSIVRSSPIMGRGNGISPSYLDYLRIMLCRGQRVEVDASELHSISTASGLAELIAKIVEGGPRNRVYHYGGLTRMTLYEYARAFAERFGFDSELVQAKVREDAPTPGGKFDYSLNSSETVQTFKTKPLSLEESLDMLERELIPAKS